MATKAMMNNIMLNLNTNIQQEMRLFMDYSEECTLTIQQLKNTRIKETMKKPNLNENEEDNTQLLIEPKNIKPIKITPTEQKHTIAIDASVIRIADSAKGTVIALRGAIIHRSNNIKVEIIGPMIRFISYEGMTTITNIETTIKTELKIFERLIQHYAATKNKNAIILLDHSLTITPDKPGNLLIDILENARNNSNIVMAFSKDSGIILSGKTLFSIDANAEPPFIIDLTDSIKYKTTTLRLAGSTYLSRLSKQMFPYRVDVYPRTAALHGFGSLILSDALIYGYPETLSIAHSMCSFTWLDVVGLQRALVKDTSAILIDEPECRTAILSPFS
ncbi:MAG: hypothetical protein QXP38_02500 [Nitrososphaerota archaeon]